MGADIHQKTFLYYKKGKKYIDSSTIPLSDTTSFSPLVEDRYYDVFQVLGCVRGNRFNIFCEQGIPKFIPNYIKDIYYRNYHSFCTYGITDLKQQLEDVVKQIEANEQKFLNLKKKYPKTYMQHWEDEDLYDSCGDVRDYEPEDYYYDSDDHYLCVYIKNILQKLESYTTIEEELISKMFDLNKTLIMFYFDS